jgi:tetratricopeptide (TPR) repeat protein
MATIRSEVGDATRAATLAERLGAAFAALDRERFDEARRTASSLLPTLQRVAAVHEVIGLAAYRTGRWPQAASELELAQSLHPSVELLPVLADAYRAMRRWSDVDRIWADVRAASPAPEVLAEARIVVAGAQADRGDLSGALRTMERARQLPTDVKRIRDHHLRQWYMLGDLHDRAGDAIEATRWFELVARHDPEFVDVTDRLRALGR